MNRIDKPYIVKDGILYFRLEDGRLWCPSQQARGKRYSIRIEDIKDKKNNSVKTLDFVAIDFETAVAKTQMPCQIGITVVSDGKVEESFSRYIQPPENKYTKNSIAVHHITPSMTENEPEFPEVWEEIKQYFEGTFIVCHNAQFDISVLRKALAYYDLSQPDILGYACTCDIFERDTLDAACYKYGVKLEKHHEAKFDSLACANLYLCYVNGTPKIHEHYNKKSHSGNLFSDEDFSSHIHLSGDILKKDLSLAIDNDNPFYDRKVVITGIFTQDRKQLASKIKSMGADINTSISKFTHYVLIGEEPGRSKIEQLDKLMNNGFNVKRLYQQDLDKILNGEYEGYFVNKEVNKDLNLTYQHFLNHRLDFSKGINPIYGKELYYGNRYSKNFPSFNQLTGNFGAFGDTYLNPDINVCVLSRTTIEALIKGEKDSTIKEIERYYNSNKAVVFEYTFASEDEILDFCKKRIDETNDTISLELYNKYVSSNQ